MLNEYFKQTMDHFGVKGTRLAKELGCGQAYISDIRRGKTNPPINRFWQILETMEKLAPGARRYFGNLVAGNDTTYFVEEIIDNVEAAEMVKLMSNLQLSKFMFALAAELGKSKLGKQANKKNSEQTETEQTQEDLMLVG